MSYTITVADNHMPILTAALQAFYNIHCGQFKPLSKIPNLFHEDERDELGQSLESLTSLVTGSATGTPLPIDSIQIAAPAKIAYDLHQILDAAVTGGMPNLVTGLVNAGDVAKTPQT